MRRLVVIPSLAALALALCGTSQAGNNPGTIAFTWDACDGPIHTKRPPSTPGIYRANISVLGTDILHKAYTLKFVYGDANQTVPDAWRFDEAGCQGSTFISIHDHPPRRSPRPAPRSCRTRPTSSKAVSRSSPRRRPWPQRS